MGNSMSDLDKIHNYHFRALLIYFFQDFVISWKPTLIQCYHQLQNRKHDDAQLQPLLYHLSTIFLIMIVVLFNQ
mgnify:CR=1 FL=1